MMMKQTTMKFSKLCNRSIKIIIHFLCVVSLLYSRTSCH